MNFTGKMMEGMMGGMNPEKMQEVISQFFSAVSAEDKQKMMEGMLEQFMNAMSPEDKQAMMKKMIGGMMGDDANPMMSMMSSMMGAKPAGMMGMMKNMMGHIGKASDLAAYATPELRNLFEEWLEQINEEVVAFIKKEGKADPATLADQFKISNDSIHYILGKLAQSGRINLKAEV